MPHPLPLTPMFFLITLNFMAIKNVKIISTIKDQVYTVLKENIINGTLKPGERILELQIAEELNVSRSPVRNAINTLLGKGLLKSIPNKSVCVRRFSNRDIIESYEFRVIVEKYAVDKIANLLDDSIIKKLNEFKAAFLEHSNINQLKEYLEVDVKFHEYLIATSGNKVIKEALDKVSLMISPFRVIALSRPKRFYDSIDEHIQIIDGLINSDRAAAILACENHLTLAKEEILANLPNMDD
ncbi:MAG: GntR family transcriptional regulator [Desulfobacter sp.]|nr:MAG: GntR family transcriptional regulator [Desulfobacter sp.]